MRIFDDLLFTLSWFWRSWSMKLNAKTDSDLKVKTFLNNFFIQMHALYMLSLFGFTCKSWLILNAYDYNFEHKLFSCDESFYLNANIFKCNISSDHDWNIVTNLSWIWMQVLINDDCWIWLAFQHHLHIENAISHYV